MGGGGQLPGVDAHEHRVADGGEHVTGVHLADHAAFTPHVTFDPCAQAQRYAHRRRLDEFDPQVAGHAVDARQAAGRALFGAVVVGHGGPVGMAVDQHGDQAAVDQVGPAAVFGVRLMLGNYMDAIGVPAAFDVQAVRVAAAAAVANAFGGGGVLQRRGVHAKSLLCWGDYSV